MAHDSIDELRYRGDRTATRLFALAGVCSGLIACVALLFLQLGQYRAALAVGVLALAVAAFMILAAYHIRFSAMSLYEVAADLRAESVTLRRRQDEFRERFAEARARDLALERALLELRMRLVEGGQIDGADDDVDVPEVDVREVREVDVRDGADGPLATAREQVATSELQVTQLLPAPR